MLRATDSRSGFAPLLRVRANLSRPFYTTAKSESGASPPCIHAPLPGQPCPHVTSLRHTSTVHFHPVKTYFLLPVFYPTAQSPPNGLPRRAAKFYRTLRHAAFRCHCTHFHALLPGAHTANPAPPCRAITIFCSRPFRLPSIKIHTTDRCLFFSRLMAALFFSGLYEPFTLCCQQVVI